MINCLIIDDEQHSIDVLTYHVNNTESLRLVGTSIDAAKALDIINSQKVDLLFLDIHMPDLSGLDIAAILQGKCDIILTTAYSNYAVEGFELGVMDYLLKPVSYPRFMKAVQKLLDRTKPAMVPPANTGEIKDDFIYVRTGSKSNVVKIVLSDIEYIESVKNYVAICHGGQRTLVYTSLKEIELSLPMKQFVRVHRSFIIALSKIERIEGSQILLHDGKVDIPLSDSYRNAFWQIVNDKIVG